MTDYNNRTPDWVKNAVFYQIFPDRFAWSSRVNKPGLFEKWDSLPTIYGFKGGDLMGVYEKLDYLEDLGINAIYLNPIFQSASNHRYHTHDYYQVDPLLGGNDAFKTLLNGAHDRGIRIVLDGVFNHASRGFFPFNHILENGQDSPYIDWFKVHGFPLNAYQGKPNYDCWWNLPALPKFNTENPIVRRYIMDIARYWIDQGIDGWRLDVPFEIKTAGFWEEFRDVVKTANPDAYIVGEIPSEAQEWLNSGDKFDAVMNYQLSHAAVSFFGGDTVNHKLAEGMMGLGNPQPMDAQTFARRTSELLELYPHESAYAQLNLLDSHDMPRFLSLMNGSVPKLKLAYNFVLTYPGAPCIYYGDEIGLAGGRDPLCRKSFTWHQEDWNVELRDAIKEAITIRHAMPALRRGSYEPIYAQDGVLAYLRRDELDTVLVVLNNANAAVKLNLAMGDAFEDSVELQDQLSDKHVRVEQQQITDLTVPPMGAMILA
jgi:neopullulanase